MPEPLPPLAPVPRRPPPVPATDEGGAALVDGGQAWRRDDVRAAVAAAEEELSRLRFHEGLRRGWAEARAEAAVREAAALARLEGVRIDADGLRALTMAHGPQWRAPDPGTALAVGIWRAQWGLVEAMDPLNQRTPAHRAARPLPGLVAGLHRDVCSALVERGDVPASTVALPVEPARLRRVLRMACGDGPAIVAAAAVLAEFRAADVLAPGSLAVGGALARWILVSRGVDPTGVAVVSALDADDPAGAGRDLGGWVRGDEDGRARWLVRVARGLGRGAREGCDVALRVQAGSLGRG